MQNTPATPPPTANPIPMPVPPEEQFWKRYSPHHEAPLSGISSVATHVVLILMILLIAWVASKVKDEDENRSLPVDVVRVQFPGGGGSKTGVGNRPGGPEASEEKENPGTAEKPSDQKPPADEPPPKLSVPIQEGIKNEFDNDPHIKRILKEGAPRTAQALFELDRDVREKLRRNVNPGVGQGGSGRGGGRDTGKDKGTGGGEGPGQAALNQREKRQLRWAMTFSTQNGIDYLNQLNGFGAIVAIPQGDGQFFVLHDLKNPKSGKVEDISKFNRIYWVDNKPQSVESLTTALGLRGIPPPDHFFFAAFFPQELEQKLTDRELAYLQQRYGKKDENIIHETKFDVIRSGGKYDVRVSGMTLNR